MWSDNEKEILMDLKKTCLIHMLLQSGSAHVNNLIQNAITVPNIVIGAVLSVSIFSATNEKWKFASGIMAVVSTILTSLGKHMGAGERAQMHCSVVRQYQALIRDINTNLLMPNMTEEEKVLFIRTTKAEIDKLFSIQPDASRWIIRDFERKYHKHVELVLYPEFSNIEQTIVRNADRVSKRISKVRTEAVGANTVEPSLYMRLTDQWARSRRVPESGTEWARTSTMEEVPSVANTMNAITPNRIRHHVVFREHEKEEEMRVVVAKEKEGQEETDQAE